VVRELEIGRSTASTSWLPGKGIDRRPASADLQTLKAQCSRSVVAYGLSPRLRAILTIIPVLSIGALRGRARRQAGDGGHSSSRHRVKKKQPMYSAYYRHIVKSNRSASTMSNSPSTVPQSRTSADHGELTVLPKHWWKGPTRKGVNGRMRPRWRFAGSGPYRIKEFVRAVVTLERVDDLGQDLPQSVGQNNFGQIRYEFFRERHRRPRAFKADQLDWILERSAKEWSRAVSRPERGPCDRKNFSDHSFSAAGTGRQRWPSLALASRIQSS